MNPILEQIITANCTFNEAAVGTFTRDSIEHIVARAFEAGRQEVIAENSIAEEAKKERLLAQQAAVVAFEEAKQAEQKKIRELAGIPHKGNYV